MIKAIKKTKTTAICPDCGKQHRIHKVSQGEYIKGCIYPCCVYWIDDAKAMISVQTVRWQCSGCDRLCAMLLDGLVCPSELVKCRLMKWRVIAREITKA